MAENKKVAKSPFKARFNASKQVDFDKYYYDVQEKVVFKSTGQKDDDGADLGVADTVYIAKKIDIHDFLESQRDSVGVDAYIRALSNIGENIDDYNTQVDKEKVDDYSQLPDTLAETMLLGDRAKAAFANMDPELKGGHTTIEGFLNSLTKETVEKYITGKLEALNPVKKEGE